MTEHWTSDDFFTSPYQLACQLALYCEAEDGYYYPRFDHDINEDEAQQYLEFWFPRYYVPNPYVGKDGFKKLACPTYVLKELYCYVKAHPNTSYESAYRDIFKESPKNNDDIIRNYINRLSKVLQWRKDGKISVTDYNPNIIFSFMDRTDKKAFFDNFTKKDIDPMDMYINSDLEGKKYMFRFYLEKSVGLSSSTVGQYVNYQFSCQPMLDVIKKLSGKDSFYDVINISMIDNIKSEVGKLQENKKRNNVYTASLTNYKDFINFLESEEARKLYRKEHDAPLVIDSVIDLNHSLPKEESAIPSIPFSVSKMISLISDTGLLYSPDLIKRFAFAMMSKQFVILSGLAGSGKTQLALAFASALIENDSQMCVVPVGADWTNREPLLGFPNALQQDNYIRPESGVLDLLIEANKEENANKPYFLILDEMNMSYVERYFADFLSAMESHKEIPLWNGNDGGVTPRSIRLPENLIIVGTINVDETTYMFSPKVLDRANVIEFKISGEEMKSFLKEKKPVDRDSISNKGADMGADFVNCIKDKSLADDSKIEDVLNLFFDGLKEVNAEFGYRSATEIYRFISQALKHDDTEKKMDLNKAIDCAVVQKLMPKLHGSRKKLEGTLNALWKNCFEDEQLKQTTTILKDNIEKAQLPLTADKIYRMYNAALSNGFTSFSEA
jgi:hypothetical protein